MLKIISLLLAVLLLSGCTNTNNPPEEKPGQAASSAPQSEQLAPSFQAEPETFSLSITAGDKTASVSLAGEARRVTDYNEKEGAVSWNYPDQQVSVGIRPQPNHLEVTITSLSGENNSFTWPLVEGESYYLPLGEGRLVPAGDATWGAHLRGSSVSVLEQLSMPFWAAAQGDSAVTVLLENPFRSSLAFAESPTLRFGLEQSYPKIDPNKTSIFRVYLTENNPVAVAKAYRGYLLERNKLVTLEQKAQKNPQIEKLFGAPHIYLWGERLITPDDVNWGEFRKALNSPQLRYIRERDTGEEGFAGVLAQAAKQDYIDSYQRNVICQGLSAALSGEGFYDPAVFPLMDGPMKALNQKGLASLHPSELLQFNKRALAANLPGVFRPVEQWANGETVEILGGLAKAGIDRAWVGLPNWEQAYAKPELVDTAAQQGYLIAAYDSYHSIHSPGEEQWNTAAFPEEQLYERAAVTNADGSFVAGFQNVGRKLNPTLSMPAVKGRMKGIMAGGLPFNSWFVDCDATGEIYDDYSPAHPTTQQQDLAARLERMRYIGEEYGLVIGSEGGHDFAAADIAFAHGIELKSFTWMDDDMKANKESTYYTGRYYSPTGGVAEKFAKPVPIKEEYKTLFLDPRFDVPLFRLVYNDSVITTYHWEWSTLKIEGEVQDRQLREFLFNVPPLYHLDSAEWAKNKEAITAHSKVWSAFARKAVRQEMTNFAYLTEDRLVQTTSFGEGLTVVANYSGNDFKHENKSIPPHKLLLLENGKAEIIG